MLKSALATIHRDRAWWWKLLIGGGVWLTGAGYPLVEGYQIESMDNTRNGFPTPLPLWRDLSSKAVQGIFAMVIDFFFFVFPVLFVGGFLLCSGLGLAVVGAGANVLRTINTVNGVLVLGWLVFAWSSSVSPVAKQLYVGEGIPQQALSSKVFRQVWPAPARWVYLRARLQSLPSYLPALVLLILAWRSVTWSGWLALFLLWLGLAALLYARLVVVQVYDLASRELQRLQWEARRARVQT
jgi:hypothetical protein